MRTPRFRPQTGLRPSGRSLNGRSLNRPGLAHGVVALAAAVAVAGCATAGPDAADPGPPRLEPAPQYEVAAAMVEGRSAPDERLNACELLDLTSEEIIDLTGADMPVVDPIGSGDLGLLCTYGGPGSPERYEAALEAAAAAEEEAAEAEAAEAEVVEGEAAVSSEAGPSEAGSGEAEAARAEAAETQTETEAAESDTAEATTAEATATTTPAPAFDPDIVPDTVAAGVVVPRGGAEAALAGQAALLGVRYACSEIRGAGAAGAASAAPGAPEAPAVVEPEPDTLYIDCAAAPTGGGVEVHTILVSGDELWHIVLLKPDTPRSPEAEATALAGLHRVAGEIIG